MQKHPRPIHDASPSLKRAIKSSLYTPTSKLANPLLHPGDLLVPLFTPESFLQSNRFLYALLYSELITT